MPKPYSIKIFLPIEKSAKLLFATAKGIKAEGIETHDGFVVRSGSGAVKNETASCHGYLKELRAALITNGVLKPSGDAYSFTQDYAFASPSTAAGVVQGRSANGRVEWKSKDRKTLKSLQDDAL